MSTRVVYSETYEPSVIRTEFETAYRGLTIKKTPQYALYYVVCPEGKVLPDYLRCNFTKLITVQRAIDRLFAELISVEALDDAPLPLPPKRSHKKKPQIEEEKEEINYIDGKNYVQKITDNPLYKGPATSS
jgi:hypothetical protein